MVSKPAIVRQADIKRAVKAVRGAGVAVGRVEVFPDGRIVIMTVASSDATGDDAAVAFDGWVKRNAR